KQTDPNIKAHLLRGAFYLLLLVAVCVIPFALGQRTTTKQSAVANPLLLGSASVSTQSSSDAPFTFDNTGSLPTARSEHTTAWLAMGRRQEASGGMEFTSFYPARYNEPFVVEGEGVRVALRPLGGTDATAQLGNGEVIYRNAYPETDSLHAVKAGRSEEFLFLQDDCAPREFEYELSELSAGTRVELVEGEVHFSNKAGQGVKIEAPWLIEATGEQRTGAVRWELEESKSGAPYRLRLVVAKGLSYPVLID